MQLMPGTAQQMARWLKIPHPRLVELLRPDTNIRLGSAYLRKVLDTYQGHRVLATAAYNAGPNRVKRWLPEQGAVPADLWVEGVPLAETRNYVKQVLAHTAVYSQRLGRPALPLSAHMAILVDCTLTLYDDLGPPRMLYDRV
jgi:soluble lytic murein transglycosylase